MKLEEAAQYLNKIRRENPLVHNITNIVVANFTANGLLALGASPVMADAKEEAAEMAAAAKAVVLNIGTLNEAAIEAMILAGKSANTHGIPVILDPVAAGATAYRSSAAKRILNEVSVSIIRGNAAEIAHLAGENWTAKGVDAGSGEGDTADIAQKAAKRLDTVIVLTGKEDIVTNGETMIIIKNGHHLLTKVTGTGCLLSSVTGAFASAAENPLKGAAAALLYYGIAAEKAAAGADGPGSFQIEFLNQLHLVKENDLLEMGSIQTKEAL
ncbi:hydroxyethylthiazole kinase [Metabacillus sp. GX 13764]|uniref:hydroxyethylthiazole kinase n=1 Tax=Metabacillus kandeliae TaxID=2900151 RepID=UPI001E5E57EA|nr:hydroxyethylthiazole kinase [Metabacillus kandeliae]MCD7035051.1 hydroxyethylthiazole kinase [Metabacillus kandeliae]